MVERRVRRVLATVALGSLACLAACGTDHATAPGAGGAASTSTQPPLSAGPPNESEIPPGSGESPDGPAPEPDADLTDAELQALLRTRSSAPGRDETCGPADVTAGLSGLDVAAGHRYTSLIITNSSAQSCVIRGLPGIGARGEWGDRFTLVVERGASAASPAKPVRLAPGAAAQAELEWTGELAGHDSERASLLVVQLADGQVPVPVVAQLADVPDDEASALDIGMSTTIRLGPFEPRP